MRITFGYSCHFSDITLHDIAGFLAPVLNTERAYKWRLSGSARQSQIGILCFDWLIYPGVSYSRKIRTK